MDIVWHTMMISAPFYLQSLIITDGMLIRPLLCCKRYMILPIQICSLNPICLSQLPGRRFYLQVTTFPQKHGSFYPHQKIVIKTTALFARSSGYARQETIIYDKKLICSSRLSPFLKKQPKAGIFFVL